MRDGINHGVITGSAIVVLFLAAVLESASTDVAEGAGNYIR